MDGGVGGEVGRAGLPEQPFAAAQFGGQRGQGPPGEMLVEVGHQPGHVRQPGAFGEGRTALVVHQQEAQLIRSVGQGE